jgi:adenylate kinase
MIVVLTGAPGAGKGTQAELLAEKCGLIKVSTGDALRKHVKNGTEIGRVADEIMKRGDLVPDDVLFEIIKQELAEAGKKTVLLDGYPRNLSQAETLATLVETHPVKVAIQLEVEKEELFRRLSGRRVCCSCGATYHIDNNPPKSEGTCDQCGQNAVSQRSDDNPESVNRRLEVYEDNTRPILHFYQQRDLLKKVSGSGATETIFSTLKGVISGL